MSAEAEKALHNRGHDVKLGDVVLDGPSATRDGRCSLCSAEAHIEVVEQKGVFKASGKALVTTCQENREAQAAQKPT